MIKRFLGMFLGACGLALTIISFMAPPAFAATYQSQDSPQVSICVGDRVPEGMVVVSRFPDPDHCGGGTLTSGLNAEGLAKAPSADGYILICAELSPLPDPDVVVAEQAFSIACQGRVFGIEQALGTVTVCKDSRIPASYQIKAATISALCSIDVLAPLANNAIIIEPHVSPRLGPSLPFVFPGGLIGSKGML